MVKKLTISKIITKLRQKRVFEIDKNPSEIENAEGLLINR